MTTQKLHVIGEVKNKKHTGTLITFMPDPTIFHDHHRVQVATASATRLRELAFLNPGLEINFTDERAEPRKAEQFLLQARHRGVREAARTRTNSSCIPKPIVLAGKRR